MILDKQHMFAESQDLHGAGTGLVASTNVVDLGAGGLASSDLRLVIKITEAFAGDTATAYALETDSAVGFGTKTIVYTKVVATAAGTLGATIIDMPLPAECKRYIRVTTQSSVDPTAGMYTAMLVLDNQSNKSNVGN